MKTGLLRRVIVVAAGLAVAACGVKSSPQPPAGATYPIQYPTPLPPIERTAREPGSPDGVAPAAINPNSFWQYPNTPPKQ